MATRKTQSATELQPSYIAEIEALISSIGEGLIATDDTGHVTRVNKPALDLFGYKKNELLHRRFTDKVIAVYEGGEPLNVIDTPIAKSYLTGEIVSQRAFYRRKDGTLTPVQVTVSPLLIKGTPVGAVQLFRDMRADIQMDKMKSDFISLASHQLRTPLSSVNIYAGMLLDDLAGELNEQQRAFVRTILASAQRMNELIDTLLNITRIEAGGIEVSPSNVEIHRLLREIIAIIKPSIDGKHMKLIFAAGSEPLLIKTDQLLIKEILINLLTNAIKYTPEKGTIEVSLLRGSKNIIISVKDNGYGIPAHAQNLVFTKFFRADNILPYDVSGTGLGLYLTKMIAESLSGDLWFESIENKGSTFYFSLPTNGSISRQGTYKVNS